jgi:hypothetical protein
MTRDWGLLVKDQDILDLVNSLPAVRMEELASRFDAIAAIVSTDAMRVKGNERAAKTRISSIEEDASHGATPAPKSSNHSNAGTAATSSQADSRRLIADIRKIGRESRAEGFRRIVEAIIRGLKRGDRWSARYTARAVVKSAFANTSDYFQALEEFCLAVRALRRNGGRRR